MVSSFTGVLRSTSANPWIGGVDELAAPVDQRLGAGKAAACRCSCASDDPRGGRDGPTTCRRIPAKRSARSRAEPKAGSGPGRTSRFTPGSRLLAGLAASWQPQFSARKPPSRSTLGAAQLCEPTCRTFEPSSRCRRQRCRWSSPSRQAGAPAENSPVITTPKSRAEFLSVRRSSRIVRREPRNCAMQKRQLCNGHADTYLAFNR